MEYHPQLTDDEIVKLKVLVKYADQIETEMAYKSARRLLIKTWRSAIIGIAGVVGAIIIIWDTIKERIFGVI